MEYHYVGMDQQARSMPTGILTDSERSFYRGENEVEDPEGYRGNARHRARNRMDQIEKDLQVLKEAGEDDLLDEFYSRFSRVGELEREVAELREKLDEEDSDS